MEESKTQWTNVLSWHLPRTKEDHKKTSFS